MPTFERNAARGHGTDGTRMPSADFIANPLKKPRPWLMNALGIARADRGRHDTCRDLDHFPYTDQGHRRRARACLASTLDWAESPALTKSIV